MERPLHTHPSTHPPKAPQKSDHPPDDEQKEPVSRVTLALSGENPEKSVRQTRRQSLHKERGSHSSSQHSAQSYYYTDLPD